MNFNFYEVLLPIALILSLSKLLEIGFRKINIPQVIAMLLAGVLIGLVNYIPNQEILLPSGVAGIGFIAKIGVILIMYSAGLETDVKKIKECGVSSLVITLLGVVVPMGLGFIVATLFNGGFSALNDQKTLMTNLFYGTILTATSVSVSVATLKEVNKLDTKVGTSIISAAILDDILGIIILSFVSSMSGDGSSDAGILSKVLTKAMGENLSSLAVIISVVLFFAFIVGLGILIRMLFTYLNNKYDHQRRIPIFGIAVCFFFAYMSERLFGVADITGAYFAGLFLSSTRDTGYIDHRSEVLGYMIFTPVFFANIGISMQFEAIDINMLFFGITFVIAGILGKLLGCSLGSIICKFNLKDSLRIGVGMMARAEVCLICAQKGIDAGLVNKGILPFILIMIIFSSFITPLILKQSYKGELSLQ